MRAWPDMNGMDSLAWPAGEDGGDAVERDGAEGEKDGGEIAAKLDRVATHPPPSRAANQPA